MVNLKKTVLSFVAPALATLCISTASWSLPNGDDSRHDPQHKVTIMAKMLGLTEEQEATVNTLLAHSLEESERDKERLHVLREQLRGQADTFDEVSTQLAADEIGQITSRMVYRRASTHAAIYQLLDDEQKVEMDEWSAQRSAKRRAHHRFPF